MSQSSPTLVVHGGAYDIPSETHQAHMDGCRRAAEAGWTMLARGGSALDAVEIAVRVMEDDPTFDAGYGSFLNAAGEVELDAIIMDGRDLELGAVAAVQRVRHPVTLARLGGVGIAHNTPYIAHAIVTPGRKVTTGIE